MGKGDRTQEGTGRGERERPREDPYEEHVWARATVPGRDGSLLRCVCRDPGLASPRRTKVNAVT